MVHRELMRSRLTNLFWNGQTHRLRLPWRLLLWLVVLVALGLLAQLLVVLVRSPSVEPLLVIVTPGLSPGRALIAVLNVVFLVLQLVVMVGSVYVAGRFLDRRWFRDFGLHLDREWWTDLGFGLAGSVESFSIASGWMVRSIPDVAPLVGIGPHDCAEFRGVLSNLKRWHRIFSASRMGCGAVDTASFSLEPGAGHWLRLPMTDEVRCPISQLQNR